MNGIKPLKHYAAPKYPTIDEIGESDLSRAPARWSGLKSVVASLGTVAMTLKAVAQDAVVEAPTTMVQTPERAVSAEKKPEAEAVPVTEVCPLLPVATAGEGRGGFGCMSMNPPVMLPEAEALDIIEREFAKRGIKLKDCPVLEGLELPSEPGKRGKVMIDLGNEEEDILVEYVSLGDHKRWEIPPAPTVREDGSMVYTYSSRHDINIRDTAERINDALTGRTGDRKVSVGVLYDPVVSLPRDWSPSVTNGTEKIKSWGPEWRALRNEAGKKLSEQRLRAQLENCFTWLEKRGKLPKAK